MFKYLSDEIYFFSIGYLFLDTRIPGQQSLFLNRNFTKYNIESAGFAETRRKILFGRRVN